jgi:hypothetical protein
MRGTVIHWDPTTSSGILRDASDRRRPFAQRAWRSPHSPVVGAEVDFELAGEEPTDIYAIAAPISASLPLAQDAAARQATNYAIVSLVCGGVGFMFWPLGLVAAVPTILFGVKAKRLGRDLADRSPYIMGVAGIVLGAVVGALGVLFGALLIAIFSTLPFAGAR